MDDEGILAISAPAAQDAQACCARDPDGAQPRHVIARFVVPQLWRSDEDVASAHTDVVRVPRDIRGWGGWRQRGRRSTLSRRVVRKHASAPPSTALFAPTLIACTDRHDEASIRRHDTHGHAFASQRTRARMYTKDTQDAKHDAALPHSCADDGALGGGAGAGSRVGPGTGRARVPGGRVEESGFRGRREGDVGAAGMLRPLPVGRALHPPSTGALRLRMGGCRSVPTTAHARGDAPTSRSAHSSSTPRSSSPWTIFSYGRPRIHPTSHSHTARGDA
ncbi:hypothetical protein DFH09DRAFT_37422 [Mycena vulgaris]|nr:hypothetical protein DFH09DRAFT_37422 [Mycena vulgaris]